MRDIILARCFCTKHYLPMLTANKILAKIQYIDIDWWMGAPSVPDANKAVVLECYNGI